MDSDIVCKACGKEHRRNLSYCPGCGAEYIPESIKTGIRTRRIKLFKRTIVVTVISIIIFIFLPPPLQGVLMALPIALILVSITFGLFIIVLAVLAVFGLISSGGGNSDLRM
ncbi:MAG: hypothetical protein ACW99Q_22030 [Candidatus Kariarchaeaceae archaeon]